MSTDRNKTLVSMFVESRSRYEDFVNCIETLISTLLSTADIRVDAIQKRVKTVEGLSEKLERHGKIYSKLEGVPDLAGLRVIAYHREDVERVVQLIHREFNVDDEESEDAAAGLALDKFGYLSVHLVIRLSTDRQALPEWSQLKDLHAEVQVRTVVQHAWASISHALQYKNEDKVPHELHRRLSRLAALLELADEEFVPLNREHTILSHSADPKTENVLMLLRRVLGRRTHSYDWIRDHAPLNLTDCDFDKLVHDHPNLLESKGIIHRDESGKRIIPGKPGMKVKIQANENNQQGEVDPNVWTANGVD